MAKKVVKKKTNNRSSKKLEVEHIPPTNLKPHPRNYRTHPDDQIEHLIKSIKEHGFYRNVVVAKDGTILAGHGVVEAALKMELEEIPVIRVSIAANDPKALKLLAGDNEIANLVEVDDRALTEMLKEIHDEAIDGLLGTGFDDKMLANLLMVTRSADEIRDFDAASEWVGMPEYDTGNKEIRLTIRFRDENRFQQFLKLIEVFDEKIHRREGGMSIWWPVEDQDDLSSVQFVEED